MGRLVADSAPWSRPQHSGVVDEIAGGLLSTGWASVKLRQGAVLTHVSTDVGKPPCQVLSLLEALAVFGENVPGSVDDDPANAAGIPWWTRMFRISSPSP